MNYVDILHKNIIPILEVRQNAYRVDEKTGEIHGTLRLGLSDMPPAELIAGALEQGLRFECSYTPQCPARSYPQMRSLIGQINENLSQAVFSLEEETGRVRLLYTMDCGDCPPSHGKIYLNFSLLSQTMSKYGNAVLCVMNGGSSEEAWALSQVNPYPRFIQELEEKLRD